MTSTKLLCTVNGLRIYRHTKGSATYYSVKSKGVIVRHGCQFNDLPRDVKEPVAKAVHAAAL